MENKIQYQINSATNACHARIENGAEIHEAFQWLNTEVEQIFNGVILYPED